MLMLGNLYLCDRTSITTYQPKAGSSHLNKLIWLTKEQIRKASEKHDKIELVREIEIDSRTDNQASFCSVPLQLLSSLKLTTIPVKISGDCVLLDYKAWRIDPTTTVTEEDKLIPFDQINFQPTLHTIYTDKLVNQNLAGHDGLRENLSGGQ
ncbi:hypothetical protein PSTT_11919 [Puccinia striiformis]|uniref:Uncharacterized protein n=1 Tax=Puccinia striiformis TaxID=27350 RepID=A0A2S4UY39_9BASI|nr:hypothetical protein PSTT_11919 [Puccinia striiformis]